MATPSTISTPKQRQLIALGRTASGLGKEHWKDIMQARWGVDSSTKLTFSAADQLITEMKEDGYLDLRKGKRRPPVPKGDNVTALASPAELKKIEMLRAVIPWKAENGYQGWLRRMNIPKIRTARDAYVIIESLKKLMDREMTKEYGPDWWCREWVEPVMREYVATHRPAKYKSSVEMMLLLTRKSAEAYREPEHRA